MDPASHKTHYREIGQTYLERLREYHATAAHITDKMPANFHYLGFVCRALPGAKIIHSMRDPMDSCLSNYTRLFNETMEFAYSLEELERYYNRYIQEQLGGSLAGLWRRSHNAARYRRR